MPFLFADPFFAVLDIFRVCSIAGPPGSFKTSMAFELARHKLDAGYSFRCNIDNVWNDSDYQPVSDYVQSQPHLRRLVSRIGFSGVVSHFNLPDLCPWVRRKVFVLDEGGRYLRAWKYFENMVEFPRKFRNYIFVPSVRVPHPDLAQLVTFCVFPFSQYLPGSPKGGFYVWKCETGYTVPVGGIFIYFPSTIGVYDTDDLSEVTDSIIRVFSEAIEYREREYGRNGIQALGSFAEDEDSNYQQAIAARLSQIALSLSNRGRGRPR